MKPYPVQLKCTIFNNTFSLYIRNKVCICTLQVHADDEFSDAARHTLVMGLRASIRGWPFQGFFSPPQLGTWINRVSRSVNR